MEIRKCITDATTISIKQRNIQQSIITEYGFTYETNLNVINNYYHIFNSNTLSLEFIVFIEINHQYLLHKFNELYLYLFNLFINVNQYYYMIIYSVQIIIY